MDGSWRRGGRAFQHKSSETTATINCLQSATRRIVECLHVPTYDRAVLLKKMTVKEYVIMVHVCM
jgi:hypothetical protein